MKEVGLMMAKSMIAIALVCGASGVAAGHGFDKSAPPLQDLLAQADHAGKLLLLDFSTAW
jgi:hypothetical protein